MNGPPLFVSAFRVSRRRLVISCRRCFWGPGGFVFVLRLETSYSQEERDRIIAGLRNHDVGAGDYFPCIHLQPFYQQQFGFRPGMFPIAESVSQRTIAVPFPSVISVRSNVDIYLFR